MITPDTFTPEQFEASLHAALKDVAPTDVKPVTVLQRLTKFRAVLKKYRAKGYSAQQIATALAQPPIGLQVSASHVRKAMNGGTRRPVQYRVILPDQPATAPAAQPAPQAVQPAPQPAHAPALVPTSAQTAPKVHMWIDPATGAVRYG